MDTTSNRLKMYMEQNNLKQVDLVKITGLGKSAISQYLSGKIVPKQDKIYILSETLNVNPAWLMGYDVPMKKDISLNNNLQKDNLSELEISLLGTFNKLNKLGKQEALKRVEELTCVSRYTSLDFQSKILA